MIPFDFIYCRPDSLKEAAETYRELKGAGKNPFYYGGGSEIITMARAGGIQPGAVIDLKSIPECVKLVPGPGGLSVGAACTLNQVKESNLFPLLGTACGRIADHTNQCRITLGGNVCGTIRYREASLPLMLADADVSLCGPDGGRTVRFSDIFHERMRLCPGEFIAQFHIPAWALRARFFHIKKTTNEKIDYPLVNVTAMAGPDGALRTAFSGLCAFPFRSAEIERVLNDRTAAPSKRVDAVPALLPEPAYTDVEGSGAYRVFVLKNTLLALLEEWEYGAV